MVIPCISETQEAEVLKSQATGQESVQGKIQEEVRRYLRFLPQVADPNLGRVQEIREEIQKGGYPTREIIEETATRLALRFLRKE